jgi:DNA recombination protein RmuC
METALLIALGLLAGLAIAAFVALLRGRTPAADPQAEQRVIELGARVQAMGEHVRAMGEFVSKAQAQLQSAVNERLDAVTAHLGSSMQATAKHTAENLQKLNERLAVIDSAQKNLTELASQMTSLRDVLANKQSRGAFGQARMEAIIQDGLPPGMYAFQYTLPNGKRPDCAVLLPNQPPLVIDAKFPLEAVTALREGKSEEERRLAAQRVRTDVLRHVNDIADKYLIPGATQDMALMFVPSEAVYAELHDSFDDIVQKAYRAQVMMVSPTLLMLAIQVIRQIQKDARMREAADQIRTEVGHMMKDVKLLGERVRKLQTHFGQAGDDLNLILTSATRIERRASRIEELEFESEEQDSAKLAPASVRRLEAGE